VQRKDLRREGGMDMDHGAARVLLLLLSRITACRILSFHKLASFTLPRVFFFILMAALCVFFFSLDESKS